MRCTNKYDKNGVMKVDLKDVTFLIPIRIDSIVRLENLVICVKFLLDKFDTNIIVLEASSYNNNLIKNLLPPIINYIFIKDNDPIFYRTKYLNSMTLRTTTPFVGIWDADVIIPYNQIIIAIDKLREGYDIAYPYDGEFFDTSSIIRELYIRNMNIQTLLNNKDKMGLIYGKEMKGGAILVNKAAYKKAGMENLKFYGWGPEDFERYERWKILNYKIFRSDGSLFHLTHSRGKNSSFRSIEQVLKTNKELKKTVLSSKEDILK